MTSKPTNLIGGVTLAAVLLASAGAQALTVDIFSSGQGWITQDGNANGTSAYNNYIAGNCGAYDCVTGEYRNFFTFNVAAGNYSSATLLLNNYDVWTYQSSPIVYQVTSLPSLSFSALGNGTVYGSRTYTTSDSQKVEGIALDAAALSAIDSGGSFGVSGRVTSSTIFDPNAPDQFVFGGSYGQAELVLTTGVPEVSTWAMMLTGVAALGFAGYRRNKGAALAA